MIKKGKIYNTVFMLAMMLSSLGYESHLFDFYSYIQILVSFLFLLLFIGYSYENGRLSIKGNRLLYAMLTMMVINSTIASLIYNENSISNALSVPLMFFTGITMYVVIPKLMDKYKKIELSLMNYMSLFCFVLALLSIVMEINGGSFLVWHKPYLTRTASIYYDANFYANIIGCGFSIVAVRNDVNKKIKFLVLSVIAYSIYLSGSRGTLLSLALAIFLYIVIFSNLKIYKKIIILFLFLIAGIQGYMYLDSADYFRTYQGSNNRLDMWEWAFEKIISSPIIGYGYGSIATLLSSSGFTNASTHNSFVDYAFSYGLICLIIYLYLIFKIIYRSIRNKLVGPILLAVLFMLFNSNTILYSFGGVGFSSIILTVFLGVLNFKNMTIMRYKLIYASNDKIHS